MRTGTSISIYLVRTVLPYFLLSWLILTVVLFIQQAGRYSEIFLSPNLPSNFAWQIALALIPNVIAFTCPMAMLVGVIIGLSRAIVDNELVAIRAAGVGNFAVVLPIAFLGGLLSLFSVFVNLYGVPIASKMLRGAALKTAMFKLESPIEPGLINTEIAGFTIYVREGDLATGQWQNVFVLQEGAGESPTRLITSRLGRVDSSAERSELVLQDATVSSFRPDRIAESYVSENIGEVRLAIKTRRDELAARLNSIQPALEEMGIPELASAARDLTGRERVEAKILIVRRIVLSFAPLLFSVLGTVMMLRFYRRGRGFGFALALVSLVGYFLFTFAGEQLARTGTIPVLLGGLLPVFATLLAISYFALASRFPSSFDFRRVPKRARNDKDPQPKKQRGSDLLIDLTTGIRDFELVFSLIKILLLSVIFLSAIFIVFTVFELWRFAGTFDNGIWLLSQYVFFLIPYIYLQIVSTAVLIAVLAVYTVKSRQNEIVTWIAAGQSIYRLIVPCLGLMLVLGILNFGVQEQIGPKVNSIQDRLRVDIRNRGVAPQKTGRQWSINENYVIGFKINLPASDNGTGKASDCGSGNCTIEDLMAFYIDPESFRLRSIYRAPQATVSSGGVKSIENGTLFSLDHGRPTESDTAGHSESVADRIFLGKDRKPAHLTIAQIKKAIDIAESETEVRAFSVALQKRYSTIVIPFVVALIAAPFALGLERKGRASSIVFGVGLWFIFVSVVSIFNQLGVNGSVSAVSAVWSPLTIFALIGIYLIFRLRT